MSITLKPEQEEALSKLNTGSVLMGGVGSGKTYTSIFWAKKYVDKGKKLYVFTTAMNRNLGAWDDSIDKCGISKDDYVVESWNNIVKYSSIRNCVVIFDEQRAIGYGTWAKTFIKIALNDNDWIMCSATPGDNWMAYLALFIANGFFSNKKEFVNNHVVYDPHVPYPKVKQYLNTELLESYREQICVPMGSDKKTKRLREYIYCQYDTIEYNYVRKFRFDKLNDKPIENGSEYTQVLRRIVATSDDREAKALHIIDNTPRLIIFYNYNYELDILIKLASMANKKYYQYHGKKHEKLPIDADVKEWVYLVNYGAGKEGWNCIVTDSILFYSLNYSYTTMEQAEGRIDRLNTKFTNLYYHILTSRSTIDIAVRDAVKNKKIFNESNWSKRN